MSSSFVSALSTIAHSLIVVHCRNIFDLMLHSVSNVSVDHDSNIPSNVVHVKEDDLMDELGKWC